MPSIRQASFSGGELSPLLSGRTDVKKIANGLATLRNGIVLPSGGLIRRPGTQTAYRVAATSLDGGLTAAYLPRVIPFYFTDGQNAVVFIVQGTFYVIRNRQYLYSSALAVTYPYMAYNAGTAYNIGDRITYAGSAYESKAVQTGVTPSPGAAWYLLMGPSVYQDGGVAWSASNAYLFAEGARTLRSGTMYRAIRDTAGSATAPESGNPDWVVDTKWNDLSLLKYSQCGDIITLTHPSYVPMELRRYADNNWKLYPMDFSAMFPWTPGTPAIEIDDLYPYVGGNDKRINTANGHYGVMWQWAVTTIGQTEFGTTFETAAVVVADATLLNTDSIVDWVAGTTYNANDKVKYGGFYYYSKVGSNIGHTPFGSKIVDSHQNRSSTTVKRTVIDTYWGKWGGTKSAVPSGLPSAFALFRDMTVTVAWYGNAAAPYRVLGYRIYRGKNNVFGLVADVDSKTVRYTDDGIEPDYATAPPTGTNPFRLLDANDAPLPSRNPSVVSFFDQRRVFANGYGQPNWMCFSDVGNFDGFDRRLIPTADDSFDISLASERLEDVRSMVPMRSLVVITGQGVWQIHGEGGPFTPATATNVMARRILKMGMAYVDPIVIGDALIALQSDGKTLRELISAPNGAGFDDTDILLFSSHLLAGSTVVGGAYTERQITHMAYDWTRKVLWCTVNDGTLIGASYSKEHELLAWHRHDMVTDNFAGTAVDQYGVPLTNQVLDICTIEEGGQASPYMVVLRRQYQDQGSGTLYFSVECLNRVPDLLNGRYFASGSLGPVRLSLLLDCCSETQNDVGTWLVTCPSWMAGMKVWAVVNYGGRTIACGPVSVPLSSPWKIDLSSYFTRVATAGLNYTVFIGFPYDTEIEQLDVDLDQNGLRSNDRMVSEGTIEVIDAYSGLVIGSDSAHTSPWNPPNQVIDPGTGNFPGLRYGPYTGQITARLQSSFNRKGRMYLKANQPYPLIITGMVREVVLGSKS